MSHKTGDIFFSAGVDDEGKTYCLELRVTAVRAGTIHLVERNKYTFADDGSLMPGVPDCWRHSFRADNGPPKGWARSKAAAYGKALPEIEAAIKRLTKLAATIRSQQTRARRAA